MKRYKIRLEKGEVGGNAMGYRPGIPGKVNSIRRWGWISLLLAGLLFPSATATAQTLTPIRVVYSTVNVRSGPGTSYTKLGEVYSGQVFVPVEKRADSTYGAWYRIPIPSTLSGGEWGWVAQRDAYGTILVVEDSSYASSVRTIMNDEGVGWVFKTGAGSSNPSLRDSSGANLKAWNGQPWVWVSSARGPDTCDWYSFYVPYRLSSQNWRSTMWLRNDAVRSAATIQGYVRDPAGRPVSGVEVRAGLPDDSPISPYGRTATTDGSGFYRLSLIPPCGQINLYVNHPSYLEKTVYVYNLSSGETRQQDITIEPALPDLVITYLSGPSSGTIGGQIAVQVTVRNQGYLSAGAFRVGFYFSTDPSITTFDVYSGYYCSFSGLSAGSSTGCSGNIGVPSSLSPGTYYLGAIVDDGNQVTESNESNNARAADSGPITLSRSNHPPVAAFVMCASASNCAPSGSTLVVNLTSGSTATIGFSAANSSDPDGDPLSYRWQIDGVQVSTTRDFSYTVGQGTHSVLLTVTDSQGASSQASGTIVVNVQSCTYTISPTSASFGASGGSGTVSVSAPAGCSWTATSNASWITITGGSSGSGSGTVTYSVAPNSGASSRTGTMTIAGQTFTVYQSGASLYMISGRVVDGSGNPISGVTISDNAGHTTTTDSNGNYTLSGLAAGTYTVAPSKTGYTFSPSSRTVSVPPDATGVNFTGSLLAYSISGRVTDSSGNPIPGVTISDNAGHTTTTGSDGRYTLSGLTAGTYTITPSKSGYAFSPASRQVTVPPDAMGVDFVGTACGISVDRSQFEFLPEGGNGVLQIATGANCPWSVEAGVPWIKIVSPSTQNGVGSGSVVFWVEANVSLESREGTIQIGGQTIQILQQGIGCSQTIQAMNAFPPGFCSLFPDVPPTSPSFYINKKEDLTSLGNAVARLINSEYMSSVAQKYRNYLVILDFGAPITVSGSYGFTLFKDNTNWATMGDVESMVYQFINGYISQAATSPVTMPILWVAIGTNNSGRMNTGDKEFREGHARALAQLISKLNANYSYTIHGKTPVLVVGAIDAENKAANCDYASPEETKEWYASYLTNSSVVLIDFGSPHWDGYEGSCNNWNAEKWTITDVVSRVHGFGMGRTIVVGQVYAEDFINAWNRIIVSSAQQKLSIGFMEGIMTQYGACIQRQHQDKSCDNTLKPVDAFTLTAKKIRRKPRWLTDIRWYDSSPNPPVLWGMSFTLSYTSQLHAVSSDLLTLKWSANDQDGDILIFDVSYIPQPGRIIPLGTVTDTTFTVDLSQLPGSPEGRFMVTAFDGLHFVTALSDPISVPEKPPSVWILAPNDGAIVPAGQLVHLHGDGADPELGLIPEENLIWISDKDGILGYGRSISVNLSPGTHTITLQGTDLSGQIATAQIRLIVAPYQIYLPIIYK
jgi:hypothetical protein